MIAKHPDAEIRDPRQRRPLEYQAIKQIYVCRSPAKEPTGEIIVHRISEIMEDSGPDCSWTVRIQEQSQDPRIRHSVCGIVFRHCPDPSETISEHYRSPSDPDILVKVS